MSLVSGSGLGDESFPSVEGATRVGHPLAGLPKLSQDKRPSKIREVVQRVVQQIGANKEIPGESVEDLGRTLELLEENKLKYNRFILRTILDENMSDRDLAKLLKQINGASIKDIVRRDLAPRKVRKDYGNILKAYDKVLESEEYERIENKEVDLSSGNMHTFYRQLQRHGFIDSESDDDLRESSSLGAAELSGEERVLWELREEWNRAYGERWYALQDTCDRRHLRLNGETEGYGWREDERKINRRIAGVEESLIAVKSLMDDRAAAKKKMKTLGDLGLWDRAELRQFETLYKATRRWSREGCMKEFLANKQEGLERDMESLLSEKVILCELMQKQELRAQIPGMSVEEIRRHWHDAVPKEPFLGFELAAQFRRNGERFLDDEKFEKIGDFLEGEIGAFSRDGRREVFLREVDLFFGGLAQKIQRRRFECGVGELTVQLYERLAMAQDGSPLAVLRKELASEGVMEAFDPELRAAIDLFAEIKEKRALVRDITATLDEIEGINEERLAVRLNVDFNLTGDAYKKLGLADWSELRYARKQGGKSLFTNELLDSLCYEPELDGDGQRPRYPDRQNRFLESFYQINLGMSYAVGNQRALEGLMKREIQYRKRGAGA